LLGIRFRGYKYIREGKVKYGNGLRDTTVGINANIYRRMTSSGMLRRVALVRADVSEELTASFIRETRICDLGTTLAVTSNPRAP
jgi:hypothetical protein